MCTWSRNTGRERCDIKRILSERGTQLLTFEQNDAAPSINKVEDIPKSEENFTRYCHDCHITQAGNAMYFIFRIRSNNMSFYNLKGSMLSWLKGERMFINKTNLATGKNCVIGWLQNSSPNLTNRLTAKNELISRFDTRVPFQLIARSIQNGEGTKYSTRALAIECAIPDAEDLEADIYSNFLDSTPAHKFSSTSQMLFIPTRPAGSVTNNVINAAIIEQNNILQHVKRIVIHNVDSLEVEIPMLQEDC